jgi:hypothetical protein
VQGVSPGQQVEALEHETDLAVADIGQLVVAHPGHVLAVEFVAAVAGRIQAAQQIHQGGFAGTRGSHDGQVFAAFDLHGNSAQRMHRLGAHHVAAGQVLDSDERHDLGG